MPSPGALLVGLVVASPAVWGALVTGTVSVDEALQRVAVVLLGMSLATAAVQRLWRSYTEHAAIARRAAPADAERGQAPAGRRRDDPVRR
jgi:hypothetical protein